MSLDRPSCLVWSTRRAADLLSSTELKVLPMVSLPSGYLVVSRETWSMVSRVLAVESPSRGERLTANDIARRYRGFDGEPWPLDSEAPPALVSGLTTSEQQDDILSYYARASSRCSCDLIYLERQSLHANIPGGAFHFKGPF